MENNDAFHKRLLATFKVETEEHLNAISSGLLKLESPLPSDSRAGIIEIIFREVHSLKGAARAVNYVEVEAVCQALESIFAGLKRQETGFSLQLFDAFHQAVNGLSELLAGGAPETTAEDRSRAAMLIQLLENVQSTLAPAESAELEGPREERAPGSRSVPCPPVERMAGQTPLTTGKSEVAPTVRISTTRLDELLFESEEFVSAKLFASRQTADLLDVHTGFVGWKRKWEGIHSELRTIRKWLEKPHRSHERRIDTQLKRLLKFLSWNTDFIASQDDSIAALAAIARQGQHSLDTMVDHLLEDMKKVLMLPFSSILDVFPKLVRELSRDQGKEAGLVIRQGEIEIDRRILEEMKDALIHLVRNCIDHGIEKPEERVRKNKPRRGTITITVSPRDGSKVEIKIADDGGGIDTEKIVETALGAGILAPEQAAKMTEREKRMLIFESGFSTSQIITDISGRGLGLAIVREKAERLGGVVSLEAHSDVGTVFHIVVPLTLATFRGILLQVEEQLFVVPTTHVERVMRVDRAEIQTAGNKETIQLDGQAISLVNLADVLELARRKASRDSVEKVHVVVLGSGEKYIAFLVDEVLNEQEVLVKKLGKQLSRVRNIAGATVLGTGRVVPILNVSDLMKSAIMASVATRIVDSLQEAQIEAKSILVVEDSITARMLLKNILAAVGYQVQTAVDGLDALSRLRSEAIDLVVSDVDMPRLNGFDLTARIRSEKKLAELPVVLVTALGSAEDREHGIDVGANAYIVKSSFDQSNLLEVIKRLI